MSDSLREAYAAAKAKRKITEAAWIAARKPTSGPEYDRDVEAQSAMVLAGSAMYGAEEDKAEIALTAARAKHWVVEERYNGIPSDANGQEMAKAFALVQYAFAAYNKAKSDSEWARYDGYGAPMYSKSRRNGDAAVEAVILVGEVAATMGATLGAAAYEAWKLAVAAAPGARLAVRNAVKKI